MTPAADPTAHFVDKWHRREPEMALAEVFCPPERRPVFRAWGALVHELREAAFELSDARVTAVKCQWWAEELLGLAQGRSRHPLTGPLASADLASDGYLALRQGRHSAATAAGGTASPPSPSR